MQRERDATLAMIAALLVLFTALLDARISVILAIVVLLAFALLTYFDRRSTSSE